MKEVATIKSGRSRWNLKQCIHCFDIIFCAEHTECFQCLRRSKWIIQRNLSLKLSWKTLVLQYCFRLLFYSSSSWWFLWWYFRFMFMFSILIGSGMRRFDLMQKKTYTMNSGNNISDHKSLLWNGKEILFFVVFLVSINLYFISYDRKQLAGFFTGGLLNWKFQTTIYFLLHSGRPLLSRTTRYHSSISFDDFSTCYSKILSLLYPIKWRIYNSYSKNTEQNYLDGLFGIRCKRDYQFPMVYEHRKCELQV